ncbi:MAG: 2-amino-4-hydroxy-6-hydroxymethyldihydropteridine diphosphokinase [Flavobacteriales bacterium]|nr:2-amino-4-hydroxy-6-hydroxymethyldihydropteridine diphosphokinase [Flavobacteriales bacterium]
MAEFTLLLGGNIGDPASIFARAEALISERMGPITARSRDHITEPWGFEDERLFLNRAIQVQSDLPPMEALHVLLRIETELGRTRSNEPGYTARTIDIDILFMEDRLLELPQLLVPHPKVQDRRFALAPLADIAPLLVHPALGRNVMEMLENTLS